MPSAEHVCSPVQVSVKATFPPPLPGWTKSAQLSRFATARAPTSVKDLITTQTLCGTHPQPLPFVYCAHTRQDLCLEQLHVPLQASASTRDQVCRVTQRVCKTAARLRGSDPGHQVMPRPGKRTSPQRAEPRTRLGATARGKPLLGLFFKGNSLPGRGSQKSEQIHTREQLWDKGMHP